MGRADTVAIEQADSRAALTLLALFASAFWVHYYLVHDVLGPLGIDELYFAHSFWLLREGVEQYSGFYSNHLPTYFWLLQPLVPPAPADDLSFVWALRATGAAAALAYGVLLFRLVPRDFLFLLPFLILFVLFGRMTEIRTDTGGLLLFNLGWWVLLRGDSRGRMVVAATCCALAVLFSARAAVMIVGFALVCIALCVRRKDYRTIGALALLAAGFATVVLIAFAAAPDRFGTMVQSVYLDPTSMMPELSLWTRVTPTDRLLLLAMVLVGLGGGAAQLARGGGQDRAIVIVGACSAQLLLVLIDPSPFQYVYGWAMLPALAGIALLGRGSPRRLHFALAGIAAALAMLMLSLSFAYVAANNRAPPTGSLFRIKYDAPIETAELRGASTPRLLQMMVEMERQQGLWNQLALLGEICRRIDGPALTTFYANPLCLHDARRDWPGLQWLALFEGRGSEATVRELERLIADRPPPLVAWGKQHFRPEIGPWGRHLLRDYDLYDGFALHRSVGSSVDSKVLRSGSSASKARPAS